MTDPKPSSNPLAVPTGRLARIAGLSSMTAGIAGNVAARAIREIGRGARPDMRDLLMTPGNVTRIADQLARMRGAAMKVGQLISMDGGEVLPPELADIMARLRDQAHFMRETTKNTINTTTKYILRLNARMGFRRKS